MSLLEQATLIVTPNGFKESKLYSVVPSDGAGDMTVVRATTATRVNENGLIEVVPRNLLTYSEAFDDGAWTKTEVTVTANSTISPDGTTNADKLIPSTSHAGHFFSQDSNITSGVAYTQSIYAKANAYSFLQIAGSTGFSTTYQNFNLSDGTLGSTNGGIATITNIGNGWYRCTYTLTSTLTGQGRFVIAIVSLSTSVRLEAFAGNGTDGISLYGAQLEQGSTATSYFPTTNRLNIPRIDYTSGQGAILVEPQRTNLLTYSEDFSNASWTKTGSSVVSGFASPSGELNAFKLIEDSGNSNHFIRKSITVLNNNSYTISVFAKYDNRSHILIKDLYSNKGGWFNLVNGTFNAFNGGICKITSLSNGFFRCDVTMTSIDVAIVYDLYMSNSETTSYQGDGTSGVYIWGAQLEQGSYATSYIPTVASTVTRNADVISKTGISSLIGQTEGTLFFNGNYKQLSTTARFITISNATNSNLVQFYTPANSSSLRGYIAINGTVIFDATIKNLNISEFFKIAIAYKSGATKIYIDGQLLITNSTIYTTGIFNVLNLANQSNNSSFEGQVQSLMIFPTALTDTELAQLTTL